MTLEKSELEDKEFNLNNRLKQTELRFQSLQKQLDETMKENSVLQGKLNTHNRSFVDQADETRESIELLKSNYERDEHKWNAE